MTPLEERLDRIERLLRDLTKETKVKKETWVKSTEIMKLTGWNAEGMRRARDNKYVRFKKVDGKFFYSVESISSTFLSSKAA